MDFNSLLTMLEESEEDNIYEEAELSAIPSKSQVKINEHDIQQSSGSKADLISKDSRPYSAPERPSENINLFSRDINTSPATFAPYFDNPENVTAGEEDIRSAEAMIIRSNRKKRKKIQRLRNGFFQIFLPHLLNFRQKSTVDAILSILTIPFVILLRISCPQPPQELLEYDTITEKYFYSKLELSTLFIQSILCPFITYFILSCLLSKVFPMFCIFIPSIFSLGLLITLMKFYGTIISHNKLTLIQIPTTENAELEKKSQERRIVEKLNIAIKICSLIIGILNAILYISLIANSLIEMMELYQIITGISKAILGLTVFAWGNSISDLISNIAMCKLALSEGSSSRGSRKYHKGSHKIFYDIMFIMFRRCYVKFDGWNWYKWTHCYAIRT